MRSEFQGQEYEVPITVRSHGKIKRPSVDRSRKSAFRARFDTGERSAISVSEWSMLFTYEYKVKTHMRLTEDDFSK